MDSNSHKDLFSSVISSIRTYTGDDPLRPWIRGIRKIRESLPPQILQEKLPRFLQKCAQAFESEPRYRNDLRYLRVWIQLMDYVDDARVVLKKMEKNQIGLKRAMFYLAYAMYYEKRKRFEDAERMYYVGVKNLAEPLGELEKAYDHFLQRTKLVKKRKVKTQETISKRAKSTSKSISSHQGETRISKNYKIDEGLGEVSQANLSTVNSKQCQDNCDHDEYPKFVQGSSDSSRKSMRTAMAKSDRKPHIAPSTTSRLSSYSAAGVGSYLCPLKGPGPMTDSKFEHHRDNGNGSGKLTRSCSDDTVVVKFVDSAIVGKSEAEDACHHGLVDPTINMKEAMNTISSMFREPLDNEPMVRRKSQRNKPKGNHQNNGFEVYIDGSFEEEQNSCCPSRKNRDENRNSDFHVKEVKAELQKPFFGAFQILADDDEDSTSGDGDKAECSMEECRPPASSTKASVNSKQNNHDESNMTSSGLREDTVVTRFVGSAVFDESRVENACHHGLVDPTINMKEAMDDINSMFGKPINFVRARRPKKKSNVLPVPDTYPKPSSLGFSILADDDFEEDSKGTTSAITSKLDEQGDLFEPTLFTKEAMADINEMFGKPLEF